MLVVEKVDTNKKTLKQKNIKTKINKNEKKILSITNFTIYSLEL
jgi:hypothetical protein